MTLGFPRLTHPCETWELTHSCYCAALACYGTLTLIKADLLLSCP